MAARGAPGKNSAKSEQHRMDEQKRKIYKSEKKKLICQKTGRIVGKRKKRVNNNGNIFRITK